MNLKSILFLYIGLALVGLSACTKEDDGPGTEPDPNMEPDTTAVEPVITNYELALDFMGALPERVNESSGLALETSSTYWTHNDRGDDAILYLIDGAGAILREVEIENSNNEDWEDLARDASGNLYIADTGNNDNDRQDLKIYIVGTDVLSSTAGQAALINVTYEDQLDYPPVSTNLNFDAEAIIYLNGFIYLFTRDRTLPYVGATRLYRIEAKAGNQSAKLLSEYKTVNEENSGSITGAAISPSGEKIAIVSNTKMWVFKNFDEEAFFDQDIDIFSLDTDTKVEAVVFVDECLVVVSDEKKDETGGNIYQADICL